MADRTCTVLEDGEVCGEPVRARGWCSKHYQRWATYGDPLLTGYTRRQCERCGGPLRDRNPYGVCQLNPDCLSEYHRRWRKHNEVRIAGVAKTWREANPEKRRAQWQRWRADNPEATRAACARWRQANPEKNRDAQVKWRVANPEKVRAARKRRLARDDRPCRRRQCGEFAAVGRYYCLLHDSESSARRYARRVRAIERGLYERQAGLCPDASHGGCGLPLGTPAGHHLDHLIPLARNGPDENWNLQLMHRDCNLSKGARLVRAAVALAESRNVAILTDRTSGYRSRVA